MNSGSTVVATSMGAGVISAAAAASPFTVSQWQELEHQAMIYKYLIAGLSVPPELVLPIQRSFESMSSRFYHHPTMGYCSLYGKKVDPEPGRCRRTDGKKWRCSKEAYPDSKYCERHMQRGRNRSRKPVESSPQSISLSSSSFSTTLAAGAGSSALGIGSATGGGAGGSSRFGTTNFQNLHFHAFGGSQATASPATSASSPGTHRQTQFYFDSIPYAIPNKDSRYVHELKPELASGSYFSEASGSNKVWPLMPTGVSSFPPPKPLESSLLHGDYHQYSSIAPGFTPEGHVKQENEPLRPFFNACPKARDSWSGLEDDRSNNSSLSTTQLSISIPMPASDFSSSSQSPRKS